MRQIAFDDINELLGLEGFEQKVARATAQSLHSGACIGIGGHQYDRQIRLKLTRLNEQRQAACHREPDV